MNPAKRYLLFVLTGLAGYYLIGWEIERKDFIIELCVFASLFAFYFLFNKKIQVSIRQLFLAGLLFRLTFLFGEPTLSDDYYRFVWDAKKVLSGENPYEKLPDESYVNGSFEKFLAGRMNSRRYYSVYPPVQQLFFLPAAFADTLSESLLMLHLVILIGELLLFYLLIIALKNEIIGRDKIKWLWLNPLWIIEVNGNLHFEGWMITYVLLGVIILHKKQNIAGSLLFSLAAGLKLVPVLFILLLKKWLGWNRTIIISLVSFSGLFVLMLPLFLSGSINNYLTSVDLYYHKFEFNASFYFILRQIGFSVSGVHPVEYLSFILMPVFVVIYLMMLFRKDRQEITGYFSAVAIILTAYYLLSTTIHPWYIIPVLFFTISAGFHFGIVWSFLVFLSYSAYSGSETLYYFMIILEYLLLFVFMIFEKKRRINFHQESVLASPFSNQNV